MVEYQEFTLDNGLRILVHEDHTTSMAVLNLLYNVGSRDESPQKTGFAHLFEHLMFGGSKHIASYDQPLQKVGGENNAFTNPDITNYYLTLPAVNLETGFWLESDRMLSLSFDPQVLEVQRKVVIEEFKQRYLNQPYGDAWLKLRPLAYTKHPYRWATIGKDIKHIEQASMEDVQEFFWRYYHPANAILVVAGNVTLEQVKKLAHKWFAPIPAGPVNDRNLQQEPSQEEARNLDVEASVPVNAIYQAYHMPPRFTPHYHQVDLLSDVLGRGKSSRLYRQLVKEESLFSSISCYVTGSLDPGLLVVTGKLNQDVSCDQGASAVRQVIDQLLQDGVQDAELTKVKNQAESSLFFAKVPLLNRAMNLALSALVGDPNYLNKEAELVTKVTAQEVSHQAKLLLGQHQSSTLNYIRKASTS